LKVLFEKIQDVLNNGISFYLETSRVSVVKGQSFYAYKIFYIICM